MYIKNQALSVIWKYSALMLGAWALRGVFNPESLCYYTNQSNILCALYFLCALLWQIGLSNYRYTTFLPRFKGAVVMCILTTMVVFDTMLGSFSGSMENRIVHYIVPVMMALDWILFDKKGVFRAYDPLWWAAVPLAYGVFVFMRAAKGPAIFGKGSRYPYWFVDVDVLGGAAVAKTCAVVLVCFVAAGYLLVLIDHLCGMAGRSGRRKDARRRSA